MDAPESFIEALPDGLGQYLPQCPSVGSKALEAHLHGAVRIHRDFRVNDVCVVESPGGIRVQPGHAWIRQMDGSEKPAWRIGIELDQGRLDDPVQAACLDRQSEKQQEQECESPHR